MQAAREQKLKNAGVTPIEWAPVSEYIDDCIIAALEISSKEAGDNQYEASKILKLQV